MNAADPLQLDMAQVRRAFDQASTGYDAAAVLQTAVREQLLERLQQVFGSGSRPG